MSMEAIDLGLSIKWANCNVGAKKPEEYGSYFSWGETLPKNIYNWDTYKWCKGGYNTQTKYNISYHYDKVDNKTILDPEDDAAYIRCGRIWRIPTNEEWKELIDNCLWTWTNDYNNTGIAGQIGISKINGNHIFLPATGFHYNNSLSKVNSYSAYWSSSLDTNNSSRAWYVYFFSDYINRSNSSRSYGFSIRPVLVNN